ncbi:DUF1697 domain-containing protein [Saprospiraceae bacterium]
MTNIMMYAVLLGGVNIGGRTVKSDELKQSFIKAGFKNPQTVLASGNVIISSDKNTDDLKNEIEAFLLKDFNFSIQVIVVDFVTLQKIVEAYPFQEAGPEYHRYIIFREKDTLLDTKMVQAETEAIVQYKNIIYWCVLKGMTLESVFSKYQAKLARKEFSTTRNINTIEKILAKA